MVIVRTLGSEATFSCDGGWESLPDRPWLAKILNDTTEHYLKALSSTSNWENYVAEQIVGIYGGEVLKLNK